MTAEPEITKVCARCKLEKPLAAFPAPDRKNCSDCAAAEAARRTAPKVPKPEGWKAPAPGETPRKRCSSCNIDKVYSAFPGPGSTICRECAFAAQQQWRAEQAAKLPMPEADADATRPTAYEPAIGAAIAERIAMGETLKAVTAEPPMPNERTLARWRLEHEDLAAMLATARQARADSRADEVAALVEAVRTGRVDAQAARVAIDGLRWLASKDDPRRYGDKVELSNPDGSLKAQVNAAVAIEALIAALPDLAGGKVLEALTVVPAPAEPEQEAA